VFSALSREVLIFGNVPAHVTHPGRANPSDERNQGLAAILLGRRHSRGDCYRS
jgi:hypothetical protein